MNNEEAARLAQRFAADVYRLAYAHTGSSADAEDVMQDVFLRLLTKAPDFADDDHARAWLLRVAVNRAHDLFRSPWRRKVPLETAESLAAPEEPIPGETLSAVLDLPPKLRTVIHLFYYEDLSVREIAQFLKVREGTVKSRLSRARTLLRQTLLKGDEDHASG